MPVRPSSVCARCDRRLQLGEAIVQVWVFSGVRDGRVIVEEEPEAVHLACSDPSYKWRHPDFHRQRLKETPEMPQPARAPAHQCLKCGKVYEPGDRITMVFRVLGVRKDPEDGGRNVACGDEWETGHHDCSDPKLNAASAGQIILA